MIFPLSFPGPVLRRSPRSLGILPSPSSVLSTWGRVLTTAPGSHSNGRKMPLPVALFIGALCHIGSVVGHVTPRGGPTRVARANTAIATPAFAFNTISNMTSCDPAVISWMYTPPTLSDSVEMTLFIQDASPPAESPSPIPNGRRVTIRGDGSITQQIAANIDPKLLGFTWTSANVTSGWYQLIATLPLLDQESSSFFVAAGRNTSCLASTTLSSSLSSSSSLFSSSSSTTSNPTSSGSPTSTGGASTASETTAVLATSSKTNRGAIAGAVIGGFAVFAAAIAAYIYLRYASRRASRVSRKWGGPHSKARAYPPASRYPGAPRRRPHSRSDSIGPFMSANDKVLVIGPMGIDSGPSGMNANAEEEDHVDPYFSPSLQNSPFPTHSLSRTPFLQSGPRHDDAAENVADTRIPSTSSDPFSDTAFSFGREVSYARTPSPALSSGGSQAETDEPVAPPSWRIPRKPVPQYNLTDPSLASPSPNMPSLVPAVYDSDSSRQAHVYGGRMDRLDGAPPLAPKRSFGDGRPVHYLIPDMPLQPQNLSK
ncbi:hypothetical protein MSAN_02198600 [Mycena sanguinolenta]|uniref:Uncharacterized protein n=1 Tax=Mycena sanguinolenta TaxID=230812 RepID=A0A8H6XDY1_9AGAR|nr:hypothetical protein MSAN_02198600 [Mycena sanguinolenta]